MRIIDADRAKEIAEVSLGDIFLQTALKLLIDKVPTIDAVPVVRCKDCKHLEEKWQSCEYDDSGNIRQPDDFCSYGERKDNGIKIN